MIEVSYISLGSGGVRGDMPNAYSLRTTRAYNFGAVETFKSLKFCLDFHRKSSSRHKQMDNGHYDSSRGSLIVLEGLDRCGKTSQCGKLVSFLDGQGFLVEAWRFPDRSTCLGEMISSYLANKTQLDDRAIHLLFSANRWEKRSLMEAKLRSGISLVVDRYCYSGVAFSAAKGLEIEWCKAPEKGLIAPDLVVYLDIPPEKAAERGGYGMERYEHLDFQRKVAQWYNILRDDVTWKVVDASLPMEAVETRLRELAVESLTACQKGRPISNLWPSTEREVK